MLPLENLTIGQLLRRSAAAHPHRPALEYNGRVWTYAEFEAEIDRIARILLGWGVRKGDHMGVWCEAEPNAIFVMHAGALIGAVVTMINTSLQHAELVERINTADIRFLVIGDGYKDVCFPVRAQGLLPECPLLQGVLYVGLSGDAQGHLTAADLEGGMASIDAVHEAEMQVRTEDPAYILFTSGTTSSPKPVLSSHFSRANSGVLQAHDLACTCEDRFCVAMPIFHCFCLSVNVMAALAVGGCLFIPVSRRTAVLLDAVHTSRCTVLSCVPALFHAMLARPDFDRFDLSSLRIGYIGGSMYPKELFCEIEEKFQFTLMSSLGQTEATAGITVCRRDDSLEVRSTTVGHFMDHVEGRIADVQTGEALPAGQIGEIQVRGYVLMQGYYHRPDETAKAFTADGWLHTGDLGCLDENGNLRITGRLKELIIRGGENISPAEIENFLAGDKRIDQYKVIGVRDDHYGEEVCLCVVHGEEPHYTEDELRAMLLGRLSAFKVPRYILFMKDLPRTLTGKVRPGELRDRAEELLGLR